MGDIGDIALSDLSSSSSESSRSSFELKHEAPNRSGYSTPLSSPDPEPSHILEPKTLLSMVSTDFNLICEQLILSEPFSIQILK